MADMVEVRWSEVSMRGRWQCRSYASAWQDMSKVLYLRHEVVQEHIQRKDNTQYRVSIRGSGRTSLSPSNRTPARHRRTGDLSCRRLRLYRGPTQGAFPRRPRHHCRTLPFHLSRADATCD